MSHADPVIQLLNGMLDKMEAKPDFWKTRCERLEKDICSLARWWQEFGDFTIHGKDAGELTKRVREIAEDAGYEWEEQ